jgi:CheY-like chemotaxis protein
MWLQQFRTITRQPILDNRMSTRLLIVDDQANARELIRNFLTMPGIAFRECASSSDAAACARDFKPHWVTMDVQMPGMSGFETIKAIKEAHPEARIIVVTSFNEQQFRDRARSAGAVGFILKENLLALRLMMERETRNINTPLPSPDVPGRSGPLARKRILVLDDDKETRTMFGLMLEDEGHHVTHAVSGPEAISLHQKRPFDLVVMELLLSGNDGFETFAELRRAASPPKFIVTARSSWTPVELHLKTVRQLGAHETFAKPFPPEQLIAAVRNVLEL